MASDYLETCFKELLDEDALLVMAKGLGLQSLIARFLRMYAEDPTALVIGLCMAGPADHQMLQDSLLADGMEPSRLPRVVTNELLGSQREELYKKGGCYLVTSRILIVDLLDGKLSPERITGVIVNQAHRVSDTSTEAFIIRIYRQRNRRGFLKAFTDEPESLLRGFGNVERVMKCLYVKRLHIWPRYHVAVKEWLGQHQPDVVELAQALTPAMKAIQQAILVAMDSCLQELKRTTTIDTSELTVEKGIFKALHTFVRSQLDPEWHRVSPKTKQVVQDLGVLRQLLDYLLRYDAVTFYQFLLSLQKANSQQRYPSLWLTSEAADRLFLHAKSRVYRIMREKPPKDKSKRDAASNAESADTASAPTRLAVILEENPKWKLLKDVLEECRQAYLTEGSEVEWVGGARVLVLVKDDRTCQQLTQYLGMGGRAMMKARFNHFLMQTWSSSQAPGVDGGKGKGKGGVGKKVRGALTGKDALATEERNLLAAEFARLTGAADCGGGVPVRKGGKAKGSKGARGHKRKRPENEDDEHATLAMAEEIFRETSGEGQDHDIIVIDDDKPSAEDHELDTVEPLDDMHVVIYTYSQAYQNMSLLDETLPSFVVLYDPDTKFVREVEVHQVSRRERIRVYFVVYEESVEEQRYLTTLKREKEAFEKLVDEKKHMVFPSEVYEVVAPGTYIAQLAQDTRARIKAQKVECNKVVVDVREFRSSLPSLLHQAGLCVIPTTLEIGDFILTPEICVERKSVADLFGSFNSGRLYTQVESMLKFYKAPTLLIEFQPEKAFALQTTGEISADIQLSNICSKLVLLTLRYTELRILWSRSSHATVDLFKSLKANNAPVDVDKALSAGGGIMTEEEQLGRNVAAQEILLRLPGVTPGNYRNIMNSVESLAELSKMSVEQLKVVMESEPAAMKLHEFFNHGERSEAGM